ncbi:chaperonin 10-like protein [Gongronella butleri]|nr:chaperonin 10-like protein [Gongronella butleri]
MSIPTTMNAVVLETFGPPDALEYKQVPVPKIKKPTEVLVKVKAAGVNPVEAKMRSGNLFHFAVKKNAILGADFSGDIVAVGDKVSKFAVGDAVLGKLNLPSGPQGSYAEYLVIDESGAISAKPATLSYIEAASFGIAYLTALQGVVYAHPLPTEVAEGQEAPKVLILGASGGVGSFGVQVGKAIGAHVVAVCSGKNAALVTELGADRIVDYTDKSAVAALAEEKDSYDVIFDLVGGDDYYNQLLPVLKKKGIFVTAVGPQEHSGSERVRIFDYISMGAGIARRSLFGAKGRYSMILTLPHDKFDETLKKWLPAQKIKGHVDDENILDLKDVAEAHKRIESHRTTGKIVLRVASD